MKDKKVILSTFFIVPANNQVYLWLTVKTTMQPVLDTLKIPILQEVIKTDRKKFWKHQNPKSGKKSTI